MVQIHLSPRLELFSTSEELAPKAGRTVPKLWHVPTEPAPTGPKSLSSSLVRITPFHGVDTGSNPVRGITLEGPSRRVPFRTVPFRSVT